jgi:hypothetical protein
MFSTAKSISADSSGNVIDVADYRDLTEKISDKIKNQLGALLQKPFILGRPKKTWNSS